MKAFVNAKLVFPDEIREGVILEENGKKVEQVYEELHEKVKNSAYEIINKK